MRSYVLFKVVRHMEKKYTTILMLLKAIEHKASHSQREMAIKLNISLGLVNKFIKELTKQGIIETKNHLKTKTEYNITPKGVIEKTKLEIQHFSHSISLYRQIKNIVSKRLTKLKKNKEDNIIFYGTGELCEIACILLKDNDYKRIRIIDDKKAGKYMCGIKIHNEAEMENISYGAILIMELENAKHVRNVLIKRGISSDKISTIFLQ